MFDICRKNSLRLLRCAEQKRNLPTLMVILITFQELLHIDSACQLTFCHSKSYHSFSLKIKICGNYLTNGFLILAQVVSVELELSSLNYFFNSERNSQNFYACYMAEFPFWFLNLWSEKYCVKNAPMEATALESPFPGVKERE